MRSKKTTALTRPWSISMAQLSAASIRGVSVVLRLHNKIRIRIPAGLTAVDTQKSDVLFVKHNRLVDNVKSSY